MDIELTFYTCLFLARCSELLGLGKDWLAQCQDNMTEWRDGAGWLGARIISDIVGVVVLRNSNSISVISWQ